MTPMVLVAATVAILGVYLTVLGTLRVHQPRPRTPQGHGRLRRWWGRLSRRGRVLVLASLAAGLAVFAITGWVVMLIVVPAALLGLPWLLSSPPNREVQVLQALDQWVRLLHGSIQTGKSVPDAIRSTRRQAPAILIAPVNHAVARLDARWTPTEALRGLADEVDSPDADAVLAALILASERGGIGTTDTLRALAESTQDRLRAMREVEAERAKPRIVVRQVTLITLTILAAALLVGRDFFAPYGSPLGQIILAVLLACYVGALAMLRQRTIPARRERVLVSA